MDQSCRGEGTKTPPRRARKHVVRNTVPISEQSFDGSPKELSYNRRVTSETQSPAAGRLNEEVGLVVASEADASRLGHNLPNDSVRADDQITDRHGAGG
jgi:hypothetical protein